MNANQAIDDATSSHRPPGSPPLPEGQTGCDTQSTCALGDDLAGDQRCSDIHSRLVPGHLLDLSAADQCRVANQRSLVGGTPSTRPAKEPAQPLEGTPDGWLELRIWAEMFHDAQQQRIASVNRAERGGVEPVVYEAYTDALTTAEKLCRRHMIRCYKRVVPVPIRRWQETTLGLGDSNIARLLGHLGHPVWATPHHWEGAGANRVLVTDPPFMRTVAQLWQYCGHGDPARSRPRKGMTADDLAGIGSPTCKMLVHLNAEGCMKVMRSPYRLVYETARLAATDKTHRVECVRCGPSGKPAQPGSPWSLGHQHAHALRIVGKELLRDLWIVSGGAQTALATQSVNDAVGGPS